MWKPCWPSEVDFKERLVVWQWDNRIFLTVSRKEHTQREYEQIERQNIEK